MYQHLVMGLERLMGRKTTRSSIGFTALLDGSRKTVVNLLPAESNATDGLRFQVYMLRFQAAFELSDNEAIALLPNRRERWIYFGSAGPDFEGYQGFFAKVTEVDQFLEALSSRRAAA